MAFNYHDVILCCFTTEYSPLPEGSRSLGFQSLLQRGYDGWYLKDELASCNHCYCSLVVEATCMDQFGTP